MSFDTDQGKNSLPTVILLFTIIISSDFGKSLVFPKNFYQKFRH